MQGAAGMWAQPVEYLQALGEICRRNGILFIARRGRHRFRPHRKNVRVRACRRDAGYSLSGQRHHRRLFAAGGDACHRRDIFAAFLGEYKDFKTFFHGHTYTGNPLGCAVGARQSRTVRQENIVEKMQPRIAYAAAAACATSFCRSLMSAMSASGAT